MILNSPYISGSLIVTGNIVALGGITISGSIASASYASNAELLDGLDSSVFVLSSSFQNYSSSNDGKVAALNTFSASILSYTSSTDDKIAQLNRETASLNLATASLNNATASIYNTTASLNAAVADIRNATASLYAATSSIYNFTSSANLRIGSLEQYTQSLNTRSASFACVTATNNFACTQYFSNASNAVSFTSTGSLYSDGGMRLTKDLYVSGTSYFNNVTVFGTQSVNYITSSQLNIASNIITVNTSTPVVRFGGLAVYDSGSLGTGLTGSILWDSEDNQWIYSNPSGSAYDSAVFLVGPRNVGVLGNETGISCNFLSKGNGMHHMTSSGIFENGTTTCFYGTSFISASGAACFAGQVCAPSIGLATGGTINNLANIQYGGYTWASYATSDGTITFSNVSGCPIKFATGEACFASAINSPGGTISQDLRIYRSANATTGYINFGSTGTNYFGFDGSKYVANGAISATNGLFSGCVGIGTVSPVSALDVNGRISLGGALFTNVAQTETGAGTLASGYNINLNSGSPVHQATGGMSGVWYDTAGIRFYTNSSQTANTTACERLRITSGGLLYLNTTSLRTTGYSTSQPGHIAAEFINYSGAQWFTNVTNDEGTYLVLGKSRGSAVGSNTVVQNGDTFGAIIFQGTDGTTTQNGAMIRAKVDGTPGANDMPGRLEFYTTADGSTTLTERMRITNTGAVGIGTTVPSDFGTGYVNLSLGCTGKIGYFNVTNGTINVEMNADGNGNIRTRSNHNLVLGTNETARVLITNTGIACFACQICAPNAVFNCLGAGAAWSTSGGTYQPIQIKSGLANSGLWVESCENDSGLYINHSSTAALIGSSYRASAGYKDLALQTAGSTRITIKCAGNVGIGQTDPSFGLEVFSSAQTAITSNNTFGANFNIIFNRSNTGGTRNCFNFLADQNAAYLRTLDNFPMVFVTAGSDRARIAANGIASFYCQVCVPKTITYGTALFMTNVPTQGDMFSIQQSIGGCGLSAQAGGDFVHIKTNVTKDDRMVGFNVRGYMYSPDIVDTDIGFYTYSPVSYVYSVSIYEKAYTGWNYCLYYSSDNRVVLVVQGSGTYGGFVLTGINTARYNQMGEMCILGVAHATCWCAQF